MVPVPIRARDAATNAPAAVSVDVAAIDHDRIVKAAEAALKQEPLTITSSRAQYSEGGPNDFYSNGDYWWPDPSRTNGLPYIRRDGESNPNNFMDHRMALRQLRDAVALLWRGRSEDRQATITTVTKAGGAAAGVLPDPQNAHEPEPAIRAGGSRRVEGEGHGHWLTRCT